MDFCNSRLIEYGTIFVFIMSLTSMWISVLFHCCLLKILCQLLSVQKWSPVCLGSPQCTFYNSVHMLNVWLSTWLICYMEPEQKINKKIQIKSYLYRISSKSTVFVSSVSLLQTPGTACHSILGFTARCTIVQSAVLRLHVSLSVCLSVRPSLLLVDQEHIGWKSWNLGN